MKPPRPPKPSSGNPPAPGDHPARGSNSDKPDDLEVYDLGTAEESDDEERERALRELVEAESRKAPDEEIHTIDVASDEPSDDVEREQALLDVLKLGSARPTESDDDVPVVEISTAEETDEAEREQTLRELLELEARRPPPGDDDVPVIEISGVPDVVDDDTKIEAIKDVLKLGPERSRRSTKRPEIPVVANISIDESSGTIDRAKAVLDVVQHAARFTQAIALAKPMESYRGRPIVLAVLAVASLAIGLYSLTAKPEWVYGPDVARIPVAEREAHLRFTTYLVAQRVNAYRDARRGFLPGSLLEVGEQWPGLSYNIIGSSEFELRAAEAGVPPVFYRSGQDPRKTLLEPSRPYLRPSQ